MAWGPDQAPLAVQLVAFDEDQVKVAELPSTMLLGLTAMLTVGAPMDVLDAADTEKPVEMLAAAN